MTAPLFVRVPKCYVDRLWELVGDHDAIPGDRPEARHAALGRILGVVDVLLRDAEDETTPTEEARA